MSTSQRSASLPFGRGLGDVLPATGQGRRFAALVLATLAFVWLALYVRILSEEAFLSLEGLDRFRFDPYVIGFAVQEMVVPLALIYLVSGTGLFRRAVTETLDRRRRLRLFALLALLHLLFFAWELTLVTAVDDLVTRGFLLVIIGGLLGGWPVGLGLGLLAMVLVGGAHFYFDPEWNAPLVDVLLWYGVYNLPASTAVWAGLIAGLLGELLRRRRFQLLPAMTAGVAVDLTAAGLIAIAFNDLATWTEVLLPTVLTTGLAMAAFVLIVHNTQAAAARSLLRETELALTQAELRALRAQINPHFFFNSLNTIRYFVRTDPETARRLLIKLSEIFQGVLEAGDFAPLGDELRYVRAYLELEQARLGERLRIVWENDAEAHLDAPVPTLILQPLVENAVVHGIAPKPEGGALTITLRVEGNELHVRVADDGVGMAPETLERALADRGAAPSAPDDDEPRRASVGLRNINNRLKLLYGERYRLQVETRPDRGTQVDVRVPLAVSSPASRPPPGAAPSVPPVRTESPSLSEG